MAFKNKLMGAGLSALEADAVQGQGNIGLIGLGTTQATALPIHSPLNVFSSVPSGTGAVLPGALPSGMMQGDSCLVVNNDSTNALLVYPPVGGTINQLSANAGFSVAANKTVIIYQTGATSYATNLTA